MAKPQIAIEIVRHGSQHGLDMPFWVVQSSGQNPRRVSDRCCLLRLSARGLAQRDQLAAQTDQHAATEGGVLATNDTRRFPLADRDRTLSPLWASPEWGEDSWG